MTDFEPFESDQEALDWIEENADWADNVPKTRRKPTMLAVYILLTAVIVASILAVIFR